MTTRARRRMLVLVLAAILPPLSAVATDVPPAAAAEPACADVPVTDVLGWWRGQDDLTAEIGPDLGGEATFTPGLVGRALSFDGDDVVGVDGFPAVTEGVTVESWVRPVATGQAQTIVSRWEYASADDTARSYALVLAGDALVWSTDETTLRRPVDVRVVAPELFDGQYHHVAATRDASTIVLYIDGVAVASQPSPGGSLNAAADTPLRVGSSAGVSPFPFVGAIDEPTVYGRSLSAAEIGAIHGAGSAGKCRGWSLQQKVVADDAAAFDHFGFSVDVDGATAVVGANTDDDAGNGSGSAYVLTRNASTWTQQAKLFAADPAALDQFGVAVAISGETVVVGSFHDDDAGDDSGSAYVFARAGTTWTQQAKLTATDAGAGDQFGISVAIDGDTVVVGASGDDDAGESSGAAYVFSRTGTTWVQQAKLTATDAAAGDELGRSVAVDGATVVAGAYLDDDGGPWSGSAYVFAGTGTTWTQQAKLVADDDEAGDQFGWAVAIDGDTVVIGADADDDSSENSGSAYVFVRAGTLWTQQAKLGAAAGAADDQIGWSVGVHGDTAVIGAAFDDYAGENSGSAYVFTRAGTTWTQQARLTGDPSADPGAEPPPVPPPGGVIVERPPAEDWFGFALAFDGTTALVSAAFDSDVAAEAGSVFAFVR